MFLHHLEAARSVQDLALKVLHGCSALESLLSTSTSELSHQPSERAALLTEATTARRHQLFLDMKSIYDVRSKVTHGSPLSLDRLRDLPGNSVKLDALLRTTFWKIVQSRDLFEFFSRGHEDDINTYFVGQLFPSSPDS
jgi:hypothetical protein